jgi:hypothetical protein
MQTEEKKQNYGVLIIRTDLEHIVVCETADFQTAHAEWKKLNEKWTTCVKEGTPFSIESPVITSFHPGLIKEIMVRPELAERPMNRGINNPYESKMREKGLNGTMKFGVPGNDILDGGYR